MNGGPNRSKRGPQIFARFWQMLFSFLFLPDGSQTWKQLIVNKTGTQETKGETKLIFIDLIYKARDFEINKLVYIFFSTCIRIERDIKDKRINIYIYTFINL